MKNRKVLNLRTHVGGLKAKTSIDSGTHKSEMELCPLGVIVKTLDGNAFFNPKTKEFYEILVPFANIIEVQISPADEKTEEPTGTTSIVKRGRPPKDSA